MPPARPFTQFDSWRSAMIWAYHVARSSHRRTEVRRQPNGSWGARPKPDVTTGGR